MMEDNRPLYDEEEYDEIDLMELVRKLLREWKLILKWCAVAVIVALVIGFSIPKEYTSTSKLAPEAAPKTNSGSLGSLASLAGINLGSIGTADAFYPDLYPDIVTSTPFVVDLFPVPVKTKDVETDYYTYLRDYTRSPWWNVVIKAPFKALGWFMDLFREKTGKVEGFAALDPARLTDEQASIASAIRNNVNLSVDKKTSIISVVVTAQDPFVAKSICDEVISRLQAYITTYRTQKARRDLDYYERLYAEAKEAYISAQQRYASYVDRNQDVMLQRVRTEQERLQNEMNLAFQLYNTCSQQLQAAKAKVQQETPVFTVINPPQVPLKRSKPSKLTILVVCVFLAAVLACIWVLWGRDLLAGLKKKEEEPESVEASQAPAKE
ncbi:MAG: chain-length determining protein [Bacteroidales bacterium]|nr:chain-length determining protein [Bacteroidales bacterium]